MRKFKIYEIKLSSSLLLYKVNFLSENSALSQKKLAKSPVFVYKFDLFMTLPNMDMHNINNLEINVKLATFQLAPPKQL